MEARASSAQFGNYHNPAKSDDPKFKTHGRYQQNGCNLRVLRSTWAKTVTITCKSHSAQLDRPNLINRGRNAGCCWPLQDGKALTKMANCVRR
jgi:hypothetical protein